MVSSIGTREKVLGEDSRTRIPIEPIRDVTTGFVDNLGRDVIERVGMRIADVLDCAEDYILGGIVVSNF